MNPRTPHLLSEVIALADEAIAAGRWDGDARWDARLHELIGEVEGARAHWKNDPGERALVNDTTALLLQVLRILQRLGPLGERDLIARYAALAAAFVPFVRTDGALALDRMARPSP